MYSSEDNLSETDGSENKFYKSNGSNLKYKNYKILNQKNFCKKFKTESYKNEKRSPIQMKPISYIKNNSHTNFISFKDKRIPSLKEDENQNQFIENKKNINNSFKNFVIPFEGISKYIMFKNKVKTKL